MIDDWRERLAQPVDAAGVAFVRIAFGCALAYSTVRFWAKGWIEELYLAPSYHFAYPGFGWVTAHPPWGLHAHFAIMTIAAVLFALGAFYRASAFVLLFCFTWVELIDQTYYLNHYYLVSLLLGLACVLPLHRTWSIDALRARGDWPDTVPRAVPVLLRAQLAIVYFFAGVAKLEADWLLRAEPLRTWLFAHSDVPVIGPLLQPAWVAFAFSWAGALFDLTVALWLSLPRTRPFAYAAVVLFHVATGLLFPIGVFPLVMIVLTTVFFAHDWPRRQPVARPMAPARPLSRPVTVAMAAYLTVQLLVPLRHFAYPGAVNWTEEGFRFAWRVMLIEKTGDVELRVVDRASGQRFTVSPRDELSPRQLAIMSTQPQMIIQYARHVAERFERKGHRDVAVYADAFSSLNGRRAQRLLDPSYDLARPSSPLAPHGAITQLEPP